MQAAIFLETLDGRDQFARGAPDLRNAGSRRLPVKQHRARAALSFATAVLAAGQVQIVTQHAEQTRGGIHIGDHFLAVHIERGDSAHWYLQRWRRSKTVFGWKISITPTLRVCENGG